MTDSDKNTKNMEINSTPPLTSQLAPTDRQSEAPLWAQVKAALTFLIVKEEMKAHTRLPSEAEMCEKFGVSRTVIREAMSQMVNERLIYRLQGKGAFVAGRREEQDFVGTTIGFSGELADKQKQVTRKILRQETGYPTQRIVKFLGVTSKTPMVYLDRLLSVDHIPRAIINMALVEDAVPGLESMQLANRSLYTTIAKQYGLRFVNADRWVEAILLVGENARLLNVEPGTPALGIESVGYNQFDKPVEYFYAIYLTDKSRLHFKASTSSI